MPRLTPPQALDQLAEWINASTDEVGIDGLLQQHGNRIPRRTLQRHLALLVEQKRIGVRGEGRATRYHRLPQPGASAQTSTAVATAVPPSTADYVPTSTEGADIRATVSQPRHLRKPVGYQLDFLSSYEPNHTAYLPPGLREQLHSLGRSPADQTPAGTFAKDILQRLLIDLSWASSHLEGNTYSHLDTERLIEFGQAAEGKNALETQMILNHKAAIEMLIEDADEVGFDAFTFKNLHAVLSQDLMRDPQASGRLRRRPVDISGTVFHPLALPQVIEDCFTLLLTKAGAIPDPFEQAFFLMVHLPYLQPFEDVNKRVSRLAANIPFIRHNLCPLSFIDVPQQAYVDGMLGVYELNRVDLLRDVFVWAYERSCQQYVAVKQNLVPPDIFRLRHRQALAEVIAAIVRQGDAPTEQAVTSRMPASVAAADHAHFVQLALAEFGALHAGNAVRFGVRPLEFGEWERRAQDMKG